MVPVSVTSRRCARTGSPSPARSAARPEDHAEAALPELAHDLAADSPVAAGHDRDPTRAGIHPPIVGLAR
jgi:hypothetical protein